MSTTFAEPDSKIDVLALGIVSAVFLAGAYFAIVRAAQAQHRGDEMLYGIGVIALLFAIHFGRPVMWRRVIRLEADDGYVSLRSGWRVRRLDVAGISAVRVFVSQEHGFLSFGYPVARVSVVVAGKLVVLLPRTRPRTAYALEAGLLSMMARSATETVSPATGADRGGVAQSGSD